MNNLLFNFQVDLENGKVLVEKEFNAELSVVWDAFTKQELLDQWWAPKPWAARTKYMDFKVGGSRFYAMVSPEGHESWQFQNYTSISPKTNFKFVSVFAEKDETQHLPGSDWDLNFREQNGVTKVSINIYNESKERMAKMLEMGFQGGFTMTLNELEILLPSFGK